MTAFTKKQLDMIGHGKRVVIEPFFGVTCELDDSTKALFRKFATEAPVFAAK